MFGVPQLASKIAEDPEVAKFANEMNAKVLQILFDPSEQMVKCFYNQVANPPPSILECHFIKTSKEELLANQMFNQILVSSIRNNPLHSLYHYVSQIYTPLLFKEQQEEKGKQNA
mmetsp:Transcript_43864/g.42399  ORF Transcript_43864/g.42399 Transcript_43864/m.42399 type:complete len:115 (+) Transcript_43864:73-417(+)